MSLTDKVRDTITYDRQSRMTYQSIADKYRIPQSYVINLLKGKRKWGGISLETFDRMFPAAQIVLNAGAPPPDHAHAVATVAQRESEVRARMISKVLRIQMPPEAQLEVIRVISETV